MNKICLVLLLVLIVAMPAFAFQDGTVGPNWNYKAISTQTTTVVKTGAGILHNLTVTGGTTGTIVVTDNASAGGPIIASYSTTNAPANYPFDVAFSSGCTVVTGAATNITVTYL